MKNNRTISDKIVFLASRFFLIIVLAGVFYPIYFVLIASVSNPVQVSNGNVLFAVKDFSLAAYGKIIRDARIWNGMRNTLFYTGVGTVLNMALTIPAAFSLAREDLPGRKSIMFFFTFTIFFSGGLIPTYLLVDNLNLTDTVWVMIVPFSVNVIHLIIARTFFEQSISKELFDAAYIDGCSEWKFFWRIALPLSKAMLAVITLYYVVLHWNEYFNGLIYLRSSELYPLQLHVRDMLMNSVVTGGAMVNSKTAMESAEGMKYGIIVFVSLPMLILYPFVQKHFAKGVMLGAIKG